MKENISTNTRNSSLFIDLNSDDVNEYVITVTEDNIVIIDDMRVVFNKNKNRYVKRKK